MCYPELKHFGARLGLPGTRNAAGLRITMGLCNMFKTVLQSLSESNQDIIHADPDVM